MKAIQRRIDRLEKQAEPADGFELELYQPGETIEDNEYPPGTRIIRLQIVNRPGECVNMEGLS